MKTTTLRTPEAVRDWIETHEHHIAALEPWDAPPERATHMVLSGYHERIRVPVGVWRQCRVISGDRLDRRMYRWDHGYSTQMFRDFDEWVSWATARLTSHPDYCNTEHGDQKGWRGHHFTAICFDTLGRICRQGSDFQRAHDEGTFPVRWVWPDQVPELWFQHDRSPGVPEVHVAGPGRMSQNTRDDLQIMVDAAVARFRDLSPEKQQHHLEKQRESWVRGEMAMGSDREELEYRARHRAERQGDS